MNSKTGGRCRCRFVTHPMFYTVQWFCVRFSLLLVRMRIVKVKWAVFGSTFVILEVDKLIELQHHQAASWLRVLLPSTNVRSLWEYDLCPYRWYHDFNSSFSKGLRPNGHYPYKNGPGRHALLDAAVLLASVGSQCTCQFSRRYLSRQSFPSKAMMRSLTCRYQEWFEETKNSIDSFANRICWFAAHAFKS